MLEMATKEYPYSECRTIVEIMQAVQALKQPRCLGLITTNDLAVDFVTQCLRADPTTISSMTWRPWRAHLAPAREVVREVAREVVRGVAREVARGVARGVAREVA